MDLKFKKLQETIQDKTVILSFAGTTVKGMVTINSTRLFKEDDGTISIRDIHEEEDDSVFKVKQDGIRTQEIYALEDEVHMDLLLVNGMIVSLMGNV